MYNDIAVIQHKPASLRFPFDAPFPLVLYAGFFNHPVGQSIQHTVASGSTNNEIICEGSVFFYIQQEDIFGFFIFQCIDYGMSEFQCIQISPLYKVEYRRMPVLR